MLPYKVLTFEDRHLPNASHSPGQATFAACCVVCGLRHANLTALSHFPWVRCHFIGARE